MPGLVTAICYGLGRRFGVQPAVVQAVLLVLAFVGYLWLASGSDTNRLGLTIWIALAVLVIGISRLIDRDWFKTPVE